MASFLNLLLDLTAPAGVTLTAPANSGSLVVSVTGNSTDTDKSGYTMKFWGAGVTTNAVAGATEATAPALPFDNLPHNVTFAAEGAKTLYFAVYDSVGNKSNEATASVNIITSLPTITIDQVAGGQAPNLPANDAGRFSVQAGYRTLTFRFSPNQAVTEWAIRRVQSTGALFTDAGNQTIGTTNGSTVGAVEAIASGAFKNITIDMRDMPNQVTEAKIIKVFAKNAAGNWSQA
jgi:hypothetical protein